MTSIKSPQPFFIFGSPRSGTSLLSRMLTHHENVVVPQESLLFRMFSSFQSRYGDLSQRENQETLLRDMLATRVIRNWEPKPRFDDATALLFRPGFGGVVEALILATAVAKDIALWGEKSPGHVFYWRQIKDCFPDAKIIHIVRDGRDVALSLLNARMGPKSFYAAARLWKGYMAEMRRVQASCDPRNFVEIRYEDLLDDAESSLRTVCHTLEIHFSERMLRFFENRTPYLTDSINAANLQRRVISDNKDKWRHAMSGPQVAEFEAVAHDCLLAKGYQPATNGHSVSRSRLAFVRWVSSPLRRFRSRAVDFQGQQEFLNLNAIKAKRLTLYYINRIRSRWRRSAQSARMPP